MDAISFVLGIRSSHLRSTHLNELIYNGADLGEEEDRRAWVTAVYEDDAGEEHSFTRRINGNGSSEYVIDGTTTSAAQYNAVLETHNILIKARNFLVFQGDVEQVAAQSPRDLTKLIEQISGSCEYKQDYDRLKLEQDKAIEESALSFNRKRSINSDVRHFQDQRREADAYKRKAEEHDRLVQQQVLWRLHKLDHEVAADRHRLEGQRDTAEQARSALTRVDADMKKVEQEHAKAVKKLRKAKDVVRAREKARTAEVPRLDALDERIKSLRKATSSTEKKIESLTTEEARLRTSVQSLETDLQAVANAERVHEEQQRAAEAAAHGALSTEDHAEYRQLRATCDRTLAAEKESLDAQRQRQRIESDKIAALRQRCDDGRRDLSDCRASIEQAQTQHEVLQRQLREATEELANLRARAQAAQAKRGEIDAREADLNSKLRECLEKLADLGAAEQETRKQARLRTLVASLKNIFSGVRGRVVDLCKPTQRRYEVALGIVLGRSSDAIVVDTEAVARECIDYMREQRFEPATFLPLDTIMPKSIRAELRALGAGTRLAVDCLTYNPAVERAVQYACSDTLVCDTLGDARELAYERRIGTKIVTVEGTILHKSGNLTGGQAPRQETGGFTGDEAEGLRRLQDSLMVQLADAAKERRQLSEESLSDLDFEVVNARVRVAEQDVEAVSRTIAAQTTRATTLESEIRTLEAEVLAATQRKDVIDAAVTAAEGVVTAREAEVFADFCARLGMQSIDQYEHAQGQLQQESLRRRAALLAQRTRLQNQLDFERLRLSETSSRLEKLRGQLSRDTAALESCVEERADLQHELDRAQQSVDEAQAAAATATSLLDTCSADVEVARRECLQRVQALDQQQSKMASLENGMAKSLANAHAILRKCKLDELEIPLRTGSLANVPLEKDSSGASSLAQMLTEWGVALDFGALDHEFVDSFDDETGVTIERRLADVELELERLRPNLRALERMEGVEARQQETEREFDSSRRTVRTAKDAFNAVKRKRLQLFTKAYDHISGQIDQIYKGLTKSTNFPLGGTAYMSLEDSEEPYLGGVKYHAMPPFKRFRDMDQLSGGEKTMAALALLFAIHSYQPSPFFVLDEVDAALDNANVAKIANYIRANAGNGLQFLVISLKNALFHQSDGLIGVYREQELSSSRTLTLDLTAFDDEVQRSQLAV